MIDDIDLRALRSFIETSSMKTRGVVMTDLDGTFVLEREGRIWLPPSVESGLIRVQKAGRVVVANTLRFPMSVIRVIGDEWHRATGGADLPLVSMKGSQVGVVRRNAAGITIFDEWQATTLEQAAIDELLQGVRGMVDGGVSDLLVFFYRRDWTQGETIWTPMEELVAATRAKYRSASHVFSGSVELLRDQLLAEPVCMVFLLVDLPQDRRMAYQHTGGSSFFTHGGMGKKDGARAMARVLDIELHASIGAGDAETDDFLAECGYAAIVGGAALEYRGLSHTARLKNVEALGELLGALGDVL